VSAAAAASALRGLIPPRALAARMNATPLVLVALLALLALGALGTLAPAASATWTCTPQDLTAGACEDLSSNCFLYTYGPEPFGIQLLRPQYTCFD
jgi:hypothetical protein